MPLRVLTDHRCEGGTGGIPAHHKPCRIDSKERRVARNVLRRGDGVVHRGGKFMLGGEAVVDRDQPAAGGFSQRRRDPIMSFDAACDHAAAMEEHKPATDSPAFSGA